MARLPRAAWTLLHYLRQSKYVYYSPATPTRAGYHYRMADGLQVKCDAALKALYDKGYVRNAALSWQQPMIELTELGRTAKVSTPAKAKG